MGRVDMGVRSFLYGYIEEAWPGARSNGSQDAFAAPHRQRSCDREAYDAVLSMLPRSGRVDS